MSQTVSQGGFFYACPDGYLRHGAKLAFVKIKLGIAAVVALLTSISPPTISRFVVAVVVNAIKRKAAARSPAHVRHKRCETVPARADGNPAAAVIAETLMATASAPRSHTAPHRIFWRVRHPVCVSKPLAPSSRLAPQAAAASNSTRPQISAKNAGFLTAIAQALPFARYVSEQRQPLVFWLHGDGLLHHEIRADSANQVKRVERLESDLYQRRRDE